MARKLLLSQHHKVPNLAGLRQDKENRAAADQEKSTQEFWGCQAHVVGPLPRAPLGL